MAKLDENASPEVVMDAAIAMKSIESLALRHII